VHHPDEVKLQFTELTEASAAAARWKPISQPRDCLIS